MAVKFPVQLFMQTAIQIYLGKYEAYLERKSRADSSQRYIEKVDRILQRVFEGISDPDSLWPAQVVTYAKMRLEAGISPKSVDNELNHISLFYKWLQWHEDLDIPNPAANLSLETLSRGISNLLDEQ